MKRNFDLVREILSAIEEAPPGRIIDGLNVDGFSPEEIGEHAILLQEAGLIEADIRRTRSPKKPYLVIIRGLTWKGHDFLAASRDDTIWNLAKEKLIKPAGAMTFDVLLDWLKAEAKKKLHILG